MMEQIVIDDEVAKIETMTYSPGPIGLIGKPDRFWLPLARLLCHT
jgi:hypothetical protein